MSLSIGVSISLLLICSNPLNFKFLFFFSFKLTVNHCRNKTLGVEGAQGFLRRDWTEGRERWFSLLGDLVKASLSGSI